MQSSGVSGVAWTVVPWREPRDCARPAQPGRRRSAEREPGAQSPTTPDERS